MSVFMEPARELPVREAFDVIVCGAGPAGVAAAIASARAGAKTALIEAKGCLGGTWTAGLLAWIIDYQNKSGIMKELIGDILKYSGDFRSAFEGSMPFNVETLKIILERKCIEAGVFIRLHTRVAFAHCDDRKIKYIVTESKSGREAWSAQNFIDATGDGDLACYAGCAWDYADPDTGLTQPMSLLGLLTGIDPLAVRDVTNGFGDWHESKQRLTDMFRRGGVDPSYGFPSLFHLQDGLFMLMANHQYKVSAINADDVTRATLNAREEVFQQIEALRSLGGVWKDLRLVATGEQIGTREGRRIKGRYELKVDDLLKGARFDDGICRCNFGIDVHSTDPEKCKGISSGHLKSKPYDIPLRSLISRDLDNLMMAGRCISGDFLAHASYRVTGDAVPMGETAGICAALAAKNQLCPHEVNAVDVIGIISDSSA